VPHFVAAPTGTFGPWWPEQITPKGGALLTGVGPRDHLDLLSGSVHVESRRSVECAEISLVRVSPIPR
jgi:hypothetical protein